MESPHKEEEAAEAAGGPSKSTWATPADCREPEVGGEYAGDPNRVRESEVMTAPDAGAEVTK